MGERICPECGRPTPANEWTAFGRHEDCAVVPEPGPRLSELGVPPRVNRLGGCSAFAFDRRGGAGQDAKRGQTSS